MKIKTLEQKHIQIIIEAFKNSGWQTKSYDILEKYLEDQNHNISHSFVAFTSSDEFIGYVTLKYKSDYKYFSENNIPEISDLNVLPDFRNKGIGAMLIEKCEKYSAIKSNYIGIGVGLYKDYGSAQRLYIKSGYLPDGHGATYNYEYVIPGEKYPLDDDLVIWFIKKL